MPDNDTMNVTKPSETQTDIHASTPNSAPPSFRSRASSSASRLDQNGNIRSDADQMLAETFNDGEASDGDEEAMDDRQRLIRQATGASADGTRVAQLNRRMTEIPSFVTSRSASTNATRPGSQIPLTPNFTSSNDGVFANLDAKPELGEKLEEQPPVRRSTCISYLKSD